MATPPQRAARTALVVVHLPPPLCVGCCAAIAPCAPATCRGGEDCSRPRAFHDRCLTQDGKCQECSQGMARHCTSPTCSRPSSGADLLTCITCSRAFHESCRVPNGQSTKLNDDNCGGHECLNCLEVDRLYQTQLTKYNELKSAGKRVLKPLPPKPPRNNMLMTCLVCFAAYHTPDCAPRGSKFNRSGFLCAQHAQARPLPHDVLWMDEFPKRWDHFPSINMLLDPDQKPILFQPPKSLIEDVIPSPPPYIEITANEYLVARPPQRQADIEMCRCKGTDCDEDCDNRATKVECTAANCAVQKRTSVRCSNRRIQRGGVRKKCAPIYTGECGFGLRLCCSVRKGQLISEYVGEVLDVDMLEARLVDAPKNCVYYMEMSYKPRLYLDARFKGNVSRFANHSCDPSAVLGRWDVGGVVRIGLFAAKDMSPGDEVTYDYGFTPFNGITTPCRCGAKTCRGTIEVIPKKKAGAAGARALAAVKPLNKKSRVDNEAVGAENENASEPVKGDNDSLTSATAPRVTPTTEQGSP